MKAKKQTQTTRRNSLFTFKSAKSSNAAKSDLTTGTTTTLTTALTTSIACG